MIKKCALCEEEFDALRSANCCNSIHTKECKQCGKIMELDPFATPSQRFKWKEKDVAPKTALTYFYTALKVHCNLKNLKKREKILASTDTEIRIITIEIKQNKQC